MYTLLGYERLPVDETAKDSGEFSKADRVGIEVELEYCNTDYAFRFFEETNPGFWNVTSDGSLKRDGLEFVFRRPWAGTNITKSLGLLDEFLSASKCKATPRTSIHAHIDVCNMKKGELYNLLMLYVIFERSLYGLVGPERWDNNNCLPVSEMPVFAEAVNRLKAAKGSLSYFKSYANSCGKYCGLNLSAIFARGHVAGAYRGSLEFRMHQGTTNVKEIERWITILLRMKKYAMSGDFDVEKASHVFSEIGPEAFTAKVFGDLAGLFIDQPGFHESLFDGIRNLEYIRDFLALEGFMGEFVEARPNVDEDEEEALVEVARPAPRPRGAAGDRLFLRELQAAAAARIIRD